jgi:predicted site-specific integrase-resolvase
MTTDKVIWRHDLQAMMAVSSETMRRWIKAGKLPKPDVAMTQKTMGWRVSTLHNCGINIPA